MGKSKEIAELGAVFTQDGGNVGIGTTSPTDKLHIKSGGNAYRMLFLEAESGSGDSGILLQGDGGHQFSIQQPGGSQGLFFYDRTNAAFRMYIDSSGNVGIGTTSPDLVGSTTTLTLNHSGGNGQLSLMGNGTVYGRIFADNATGDLKMGNPTSNDVMFYTGNLEVMRITSDRTTKLSTAQHMGGATSFPSWSGEGGYLKGYFNGGGSGPYNRYLDVAALGDSSWGGIMRFITNPDSSSTGLERMRIDQAGRVTTTYQPSFFVSAGNGFNTNGYLNSFGTIQHNIGGHFNNSTGQFTAPVTGRYLITAGVLVDTGTGRLEFKFNHNGATLASGNGTGSVYDGPTITAIVQMNANDYIRVDRVSGTAYANGNHGNTYFGGYLLG